MSRRNSAGEWIGFLHRDNELAQPASGWANHATVMGYFLHRLKDGKSLYRQHEIRGGTHSFLRLKTWCRVDPVPANVLTYRVTPQDFSPTDYPLNVALDLSYELNGEDVIVRFVFTNEEPLLTAHVGFGLHPGFAAQTAQSFSFKMPAGTYRRHFSPNNYLATATEDVRFVGGEMPFAKDKLVGSYILELLDVPDRTFTFSDGASGRSVTFDFGEVPYLTLWSDGGAFLCIEPCWGLTDHDEPRPFEDKAGIQRIRPGGTLAAEFTMRPRLS